MQRLPTVEQLAEAIASARVSQTQTDEQLAAIVHDVMVRQNRDYTRWTVRATRERAKQRARARTGELAQAS